MYRGTPELKMLLARSRQKELVAQAREARVSRVHEQSRWTALRLQLGRGLVAVGSRLQREEPCPDLIRSTR